MYFSILMYLLVTYIVNSFFFQKFALQVFFFLFLFCNYAEF